MRHCHLEAHLEACGACVGHRDEWHTTHYRLRLHHKCLSSLRGVKTSGGQLPPRCEGERWSAPSEV